jgi:hypothetical protein
MALRKTTEVGQEVETVSVDVLGGATGLERTCNYSDVGCTSNVRFRAFVGGRLILCCGRHLAVAVTQLALYKDAPTSKRQKRFRGTSHSRAVN